MPTQILELNRHKTQTEEKVVSIVADRSGVYEETYLYEENEYLSTDHIIYQATIHHNFVLERTVGDAVLLKNTKNSKDELWVYPNTNEYELIKYKKLIKKD
jgi:hypothetical protein